MATATTEPVRLPPGTRVPKLIQTLQFLVSNHAMFSALSRRYDSDVVRVNLPRNNHAVVINDPVLAKELFNTGTELVERPPSGAGSIGEAFGPGSTFSLAGDEHRERRKLLAPPFHGKRMRSYDRIIEEEVMREIAVEVRAKYPVAEIACQHRTGRLEIGETSLLVTVSSGHRREAFEACHAYVDALKERAPIWKKEEGEWVQGVTPRPRS